MALAQRLASEGHSLRLVSRSSDIPRIETVNAAKIEYVAADLRDEHVWSGLMNDADAIVHLASRTDLRVAEADPSEDERINIDPVRALVKASGRATAPPRVIFASTVTIAGVAPALPVDEKTPDQPCSVYDRHKLACEGILHEATTQGLVRSCSLRLSNVYGYGGTSLNANRGILNVMLKRAAVGEALTLFGDGSYVRDCIHLDDVVDVFCRAISSDQVSDGGHYVIATGRGCRLAEAYELIAAEALRQMGRHVEIRHVPEPDDLQPIDRRNFVGNSSWFQQRTGWRPMIDLEAGIRDYFPRVAARSMIGAR
jgi:nucleoside-diphosphate-sugar epimerase